MTMPSMSASSSSGATGGTAGGGNSDWNVNFGGGDISGGGLSIPWWFWAGIALAAVVWAKKKG